MLEEFAYLGKEKAYEVVVDQHPAHCRPDRGYRAAAPAELFPPRLENSEEELNRHGVGQGATELYGEEPPQLIVDRLNVELDEHPGQVRRGVYVRPEAGAAQSLENGYLVGSRGSVGSSLVAYMSGITEVNSLPPHYRCPKCKNTGVHHRTAATAAARTCRTRSAPCAARSTSRTASTSPLRPSWASAAARCRIST